MVVNCNLLIKPKTQFMLKRIIAVITVIIATNCSIAFAQCNTPINLPYFNGFENEINGQTPGCFTTQNIVNQISVTVGGIGYEGSKALSFYVTSNPWGRGWLFLPRIDFTGGKTYRISFKYRGSCPFPVPDNDPGWFAVGIGSTPNADSMTIKGGTSFLYNDYRSFEVLFSMPAGTFFIGIRYIQPDGWTNSLTIDNLSVSEYSPNQNCNNVVASLASDCCSGGTITASSNVGINSISWLLNGRIISTERGTWETNGTTIAGGNGSGSGANQLTNPFAIAQDTAGNVYVADAGNNRIQKFIPGNPNGITVAGGNGIGSGNNQLNNPRGVFLDLSGNIYISDAGNNRVQKWAKNAISGITVAGGNGQGNASNQLDFPYGLYVDKGGTIYIADANNSRVQKWMPNAISAITVAGGNGNGNGANQLSYATGVCLDAFANVYVNDFSNNRVQKWLVDSTTGITVAGGNGAGFGANQLDAPRGIYVDCNGNVFVADQNNNRIQKWLPGEIAGTTIAGGNGSGNTSIQLSSPAAVFGDRNGNIHIADRLNNRIQQFSLQKTKKYSGITNGVYKAIINTTDCCSINSQPVTINPVYNDTICPGSSIYFVSGNNSVNNTYQWQIDTGNGYINIGNNITYSGANSDTLKLNAPSTSFYGFSYRCIINGNTISAEHTLRFAVKWTGYCSLWSNPQSWNCGVIPDENTDVLVDQSYYYSSPVVITNAACRSIKLLPGSNLRVRIGYKLEIKNNSVQ
jgi:sugar lactone lactonase YvrE